MHWFSASGEDAIMIKNTLTVYFKVLLIEFYLSPSLQILAVYMHHDLVVYMPFVVGKSLTTNFLNNAEPDRCKKKFILNNTSRKSDSNYTKIKFSKTYKQTKH